MYTITLAYGVIISSIIKYFLFGDWLPTRESLSGAVVGAALRCILTTPLD